MGSWCKFLRELNLLRLSATTQCLTISRCHSLSSQQKLKHGYHRMLQHWHSTSRHLICPLSASPAFRLYSIDSSVQGRMQSTKVCASMKAKTILSQKWQRSMTAFSNTSRFVSSKHNEPSVEEEGYARIYRFKYIIQLRLLSRMKLYQTGFTVVALPPLFYGYTVGSVSSNAFSTAVAVASIAGAMLYVMSGYSRRLVGLMSISPDKAMVCVSCLTFWGNRRDIYIPVDDIVPVSDTSDRATDAYVKLYRYSTSEYFYFSPRYGLIMDKDLFTYVLGEMK